MIERNTGDLTAGQHILTWAGQRELFGQTDGLRPHEVRRQGVRYLGRAAGNVLLVGLLLAGAQELGSPEDGLVAPAVQALPGDTADNVLDIGELFISGRLDHFDDPSTCGIDAGNEWYATQRMQIEMGGRDISPEELTASMNDTTSSPANAC